MASINLSKISTRAPKALDKEKTKAKTAKILEELDELQNLLYANQTANVLIVIQGMDASGKDGLVKNVLGTLNPLGVTVKPYKAPTAEELQHDFLWRIHKAVPAKGMIQVFNRSHYEDILITRVHGWCNDAVAKQRMQAINDFEQLITQHNQTTILKLYLHISPEEQQQRLKERMEDPRKMWKYNAKDFEEAKLWKQYMKMYDDCFKHCNKIPWHVIPADQNWYKEYLVAQLLKDTLLQLKQKYPKIIAVNAPKK
jgi:PPK2 family polyphosphate:nucleotide phosphotransferase